MTKSYYEKLLPANIHIFCDRGNMLGVKNYKRRNSVFLIEV